MQEIESDIERARRLNGRAVTDDEARESAGKVARECARRTREPHYVIRLLDREDWIDTPYRVLSRTDLLGYTRYREAVVKLEVHP